MLTVEGTQKAPGLKFAIVVSKFNDFVTDRLQTGAIEGLEAAGVGADDVCVIKVPGAFEMPFAVLTTNSVEEALERAGDGPGNKGWEAAVAAVEMATLQRALRQPRTTNSVNV